MPRTGCLPERRIFDAYRRISLFGRGIRVSKVPLHEEVEIHLVPNETHQILYVRIRWNKEMVLSTTLPLEGIQVHS